MKNITKLLALAMLSTMSIPALTACTADDVEVTALVGTWKSVELFDDDYEYIAFAADGTGLKWEVMKNDASGTRHDQESFTYTLTGNKVTIVEADGDRDVETVKISNGGKRLKLDGDNYERQ